MNDVIVRLASITIQNFKNVKHGFLSFENTRKNYKSSILGLYGQNGSGKTALIDAIEFLWYMLRGLEAPIKFADFINVDSEYATLEYEFDIKLSDENYRVGYEVSFRKEEDHISLNSEYSLNPQKKYRISVYSEVVKSLILSTTGKKSRAGKLIDTNTNEIFSPKAKMDLLIGKNKETMIELLAAKKYARDYSRSFVFFPNFLAAVREQKKNKDGALLIYSGLLESLEKFGKEDLFVINTQNSGMISLNAQPFIFKYEDKNIGAAGKVMLPLEIPVVIREKMLEMVKNIISSMNIVLEQIIPKLTIKIKEIGKQLLDDGQNGVQIQLMSSRNNKEIALRDESEGIKKIISILQLLIVVYNKSSITVAIDELDAGVFEYLLGELLRIISEKGKGQLIFTSHNLRLLETLDKGFVAFTTVNPDKRYIRLNNVKENNNLRDFYYRDIILGEQNEILYEPTNNAEISFAFREAGEEIDS